MDDKNFLNKGIIKALIFSGILIVAAIYFTNSEPPRESETPSNNQGVIANKVYSPPSPAVAAALRPYVPSRSAVNSDKYYDSNYKYNYRTGGSGRYNYNYDVSGYSDYGDYVYGEIDIEGKYGEGYVYDEYGDEIYVDVEWSGYGTLEGYDEDGNYYEFEVE